MALWLALIMQATQPMAGTSFDLAPRKPTDLTVVPRCQEVAASEDLVVCGRRPNRYRLPLPTEKAPSFDRAHGEAPTGMAALTPSGRCGIFAGERTCNKREAAEYGYGNGRDPITVLRRLAKKVVDPDAD